MRASLPAFVPGHDVSRQIPPHNAYDPQLGYYHQPCAGWFPYPYDHKDSRWGYYRCGRWSLHHSTQAYPMSSIWYRGGALGHSGGLPMGSPISTPPPATTHAGVTAKPSTSVPGMNDYALQPPGAPIHNGVPQSQATVTRSAFTNRGGFGSTGHSSGFFSGT